MSASTGLREAAVRERLAGVPDPELPMLSIADLGMIHAVTVSSGRIDVELLPTVVGCPAQDLIREAVAAALQPLGRPVEVRMTFAVPWTTERITPAGRDALRSAGIAPPGSPVELRCPHCGAADVTLDNLFGPTPCRSLHYCRSCRQPFESLKDL